MEIKYCPNCGAKVEGNAPFCANCGAKLSGKMDFTKGKESIQKIKDASIEKADNLAEIASKKTGNKIKPVWLFGSIGAAIVVIFVAIFLLMPKHLDGDYVVKASFLGIEFTDTYTFKDDHYTENDQYSKKKGTYKIKDDKITFTSNKGKKETGTLADNKKSFTLDGAKFKKDE